MRGCIDLQGRTRRWYSYHLKTAYTALYGLRTARAANDPLNNAVSLSTPIDEDITLEDAVPDPNGAESFERVEDDVYRQQLHDALCEAMEDIPAECSNIIRRRYLRRMNLMPRWEDGVFDRLVSGEVTGEEPVQLRKGCRIWQLKKDVDVAMRFIGYEEQVRKFGEPDAGNYTLVFDGDLGTSDLEQIYTICRDTPPPGYQGYRMALSDVVELYDDSSSEFYYCDRVGFQPIQFKRDPCIDMTL